MTIDVKHVAKLAELKISPQDEKKFETQLEEVLGYIDKLKQVDTKETEITAQTTGLENVSRNDRTTPSLTQEEATSQTKLKHNGFFEVKAILEE